MNDFGGGGSCGWTKIGGMLALWIQLYYNVNY